MNTKRLFLFAALGLSLVGAGIADQQPGDGTQASGSKNRPSANTTPVKEPCQLTGEDYAVFTAVLEGLGKPEDPEEAWKGREILVKDMTGAGEVQDGQWGGWGFKSNSQDAPSAETRADYKTKSADSCPLRANWGKTELYKSIPHGEIKTYFDRRKGHDGWKDFYQNHPNAAGFWTFSRPGYNSKADEAVLYVTHSCGWLCGTGHLYLLAKTEGRWSVKNRLFLWIS